MSSSPVVPHFLIFGCGGTGSKILNQFQKIHGSAEQTIAVETDRQALDSVKADVCILLGNGQIKAWGEGDPAESARAVIEAGTEFESLIKPGDFVFLVAGLGGGAGSGATPQIAQIARGKGALVIAIISMPFLIQQKTINKAKGGLRHLLHSADSVIVLDNDRYRSLFPDCTRDQLHAKINGMIIDVIAGVIGSLTVPCRINVDYKDVIAVFRNKGLSILLAGEADDPCRNKNESVARKCLTSPSYDVDFRGATGCFILYWAGYEFNAYDAEEIAISLTFDLDLHADVVWSAETTQPMEGRVRAYAIVIGIRGKMYQHYDVFDEGLRRECRG